MRPRYFIIAGNGRPCLDGEAEAAARLTGLPVTYLQPSLAVLADVQSCCLDLAGHGVVVGTLFHRHGPARPVDKLDADAEAVAASGGGRLLEAFWGGYVAVIAGRNQVRVLRDPSAAIPCWLAARGDLTAIASDADLLIDAGFATADIDWEAMAPHLLGAGVPSCTTTIRGISELLPGFGFELPCRDQQSPCWSPWDHVLNEPANAVQGAERLARTVRHCARAWSAPHRRIVLSVSGGFDSSVVAACLASGPAEILCLTFFGDEPGGDERIYARELCATLGLPLVERLYRLEDIDLDTAPAPHLPRPFGRTQALPYERAHLEVAEDMDANAFMTGNGGDSVFGYSQSAAVIVDRWLVEGLGGGLASTIADVCRQTGCSAVQALAAALRISRGPRAYRCLPNRLFLHPDVAAGADSAIIHHPWLDAPARALPGKAAHIASILRILTCMEPGRSLRLPVLNPLMSQPVVEACLAIPSWEWRTGGRDRALARTAFRDDLPASILSRRVKGGPEGFAAFILDRMRGGIRERLLDGRLAANRILDTRLLESALREGRTVPGEERVRILELVAAEAWVSAWSSKMPPYPKVRAEGADAPS